MPICEFFFHALFLDWPGGILLEGSVFPCCLMGLVPLLFDGPGDPAVDGPDAPVVRWAW